MTNVRPGPKGRVDESPVSLSRLPRMGGKRVAGFIKRYVSVPSGVGVSEPFVYRPWQLEMVRGLYDSPRPRQGLVSVARGNGKSTFAATLAIFELFTTQSAQVIVVASDQRQAGIILNTVRQMISMSPELSKRARLLKDSIEIPGMRSEMYALPSDPGALQGWNPSLCLIDELAFVNHQTWESIVGFQGKRAESLTLAISTPSDRHDSVMSELIELGRSERDPSFYLREWLSDPSHPVDCQHCWDTANPALDDFLSREGMRSLLSTMREPAFRRYRLNQFIEHSSSWLTKAQWQALHSDRTVSRGEPIVIGFDGSFNSDSTGLVGCTVAAPHHVFLIASWEKPARSNDWRVPRLEVERTVDAAFHEFNVVELAADPPGWRSEIAEWGRRYGSNTVLEYPTFVRARMGRATDLATQSILSRAITHDGNPDLERHVLNCVVENTKFGDVLMKDHRVSERKIDLAVAMVVAHDRAMYHAATKRPSRKLVAVG
jgi:phage terminase large subunit-like protein